jgi:hypothetical protein
VPHPRRSDRQRQARHLPPPAASKPRSSSGCPAARRCRTAAFSAASSASSWADPMCSMSRDPRRDEYTICTAVAPEAVFTVRTYATDPTAQRRPFSAQISVVRTTKPQVNALCPTKITKCGTSQGSRLGSPDGRRTARSRLAHRQPPAGGGAAQNGVHSRS